MGRPFPAYSRGRLVEKLHLSVRLSSPHYSVHRGSTFVPGKAGDFFVTVLVDPDGGWQHPCPPCIPCTLCVVSTAHPLLLAARHFSRSVTLSCPPLSASPLCRTRSSAYIPISLCLRSFRSSLSFWIHPKSHLPVIIPPDSALSTLRLPLYLSFPM